MAETVTLDQVETLGASLPGDLRDQCLETAVESRAAAGLLKGLDIFPSRVIDGYEGSPAGCGFSLCEQVWRHLFHGWSRRDAIPQPSRGECALGHHACGSVRRAHADLGLKIWPEDLALARPGPVGP